MVFVNHPVFPVLHLNQPSGWLVLSHRCPFELPSKFQHWYWVAWWIAYRTTPGSQLVLSSIDTTLSPPALMIWAWANGPQETSQTAAVKVSSGDKCQQSKRKTRLMGTVWQSLELNKHCYRILRREEVRQVSSLSRTIVVLCKWNEVRDCWLER